MKKRTEFYEGIFVDFKGGEREYTIAAVSCLIDENDESAGDAEVKQLRLGIAVRREGDEYSRGIGMAEAERKAMENPFTVLRADTLGVINQPVVEAVLKQEAEFFEKNPGKYLAAYNKDKEEYFLDLEMEKLRNELSPMAKQVHDYLLTAPEEEIRKLGECVIYDIMKQQRGKE
jgi:hypothetical protein|nr:MAG TPA: hypothetical protein [Caudoviricetes sp.]